MPSENTWASVAGLKNSGSTGRIRTWSRTPNFGSLPKDSLPVQPYDDWVCRTSQQPVTAYTQSTGGGPPSYVYNNSYPDFNDTIKSNMGSQMTASDIVSDASSLENSVMVKALGKIADAKVNLAVSLAEASKTSDLILGTARRIDRAYRAFRRGDFGEVARQLDLTPGRIHRKWLEYKYGWTPLLMEVKGAAEFLAQQHVGRPPRFTVSAKESRPYNRTLVTNFVPWGGTIANASYTETTVLSNEVKVKIWCELTNPRLSAVQQLGLTNPALIAWELIPYSFVFDWFISVGNFLEASTALQGVHVRRAMRSNKVSCAYTRDIPATSRLNGSTWYHNGHYFTQSTLRHYARGVTSPSTAQIYPPKNKGLNFQKLITSLALIKGSYRSSTRI